MSKWGTIILASAFAVAIIGAVTLRSRKNTNTKSGNEQQLLREFRLHPSPFKPEYMALVDTARDAKNYDTAIEVLKAAALDEPKNAFIFELLGDVYQEQGNIAGAEAAYRRAILDDAGGVVVYTKLADLLWEHDRQHAADIEVLLRQGIATTGHVNIMKRLARYYSDIADTKHALELWTMVLKQEPNNTAVADEIARLKKGQ